MLGRLPRMLAGCASGRLAETWTVKPRVSGACSGLVCSSSFPCFRRAAFAIPSPSMTGERPMWGGRLGAGRIRHAGNNRRTFPPKPSASGKVRVRRKGADSVARGKTVTLTAADRQCWVLLPHKRPFRTRQCGSSLNGRGTDSQCLDHRRPEGSSKASYLIILRQKYLRL